MNPLLLIIAALICSQFIKTIRQNPFYTGITIFSTILLVISFYTLSEKYYWVWLIAAFLLTLPLFLRRPEEDHPEEDELHVFNPNA